MKCRYMWASVGFVYRVVYKVPCWVLQTVVSRKFTFVGDWSQVNLKVGWQVFRCSIKLVSSVEPCCHSIKMSSMYRTQRRGCSRYV